MNLGRFSFSGLAGLTSQFLNGTHWRVLRTASGQNGPSHGSEPLGSSAPVGQSAGIWKVMARKMYARLGALHLNWSEQVLCFRMVRTNGNWPWTFYCIPHKLTYSVAPVAKFLYGRMAEFVIQTMWTRHNFRVIVFTKQVLWITSCVLEDSEWFGTSCKILCK